jgi:hypothetical protein
VKAGISKIAFLSSPLFLAKVMLALLSVQWIMAGWFYLDRMSFLDAPFMLLEIMVSGQPAIQVGRYGSVLTQFWPWLGYQMGWSLDSLMLIYSLAFPTLFLLVGVVLYRIGQYAWVILLGGYFLLIYTDAFFWTNNEIHQAVALFCLTGGFFYAYLERDKMPVWVAALLVLGMGLAIFTHPLMLVLAVFGLVLLGFSPVWKHHRKAAITAMLVITGWSVMKYYASKANWYDGGKITRLTETKTGDWMTFYERPFWSLFLPQIGSYYPHLILFMLALILALFIPKTRWVGLIGLLFTIGYLILQSAVLDRFDRFYAESQLMLLSFFLLAPWVIVPFSRSGWRWIPAALIYVSVIWWVVQIVPSTQRFEARLDWHESNIEAFRLEGRSKVVLAPLTEAEKKLLQMPWGLPAESLLLSSRDGGLSLTYIAPDFFNKVTPPTHFHNCFDTLAIQKLPAHYFQLDTINDYFRPTGE